MICGANGATGAKDGVGREHARPCVRSRTRDAEIGGVMQMAHGDAERASPARGETRIAELGVDVLSPRRSPARGHLHLYSLFTRSMLQTRFQHKAIAICIFIVIQFNLFPSRLTRYLLIFRNYQTSLILRHFGSLSRRGGDDEIRCYSHLFLANFIQSPQAHCDSSPTPIAASVCCAIDNKGTAFPPRKDTEIVRRFSAIGICYRYHYCSRKLCGKTKRF